MPLGQLEQFRQKCQTRELLCLRYPAAFVMGLTSFPDGYDLIIPKRSSKPRDLNRLASEDPARQKRQRPQTGPAQALSDTPPDASTSGPT